MKIRRCEINDADNMLKMLLELDKETEYMLFEADERSNDINRVKAMINQSINGDNLLLIATEDDNIIGFLSAQRGIIRKIKHTAYIVVGIREKFRGKGIGKKLFCELDLWAKENNISRLELTVMCPNSMAKQLYEKNGFEVEGTKRNSIFMNGKYIDEYYMSKIYK
ncbi:GNAT family N-acetyltransferase [uncultured Clostridium sp.]|uniref:GNAT family N-acetyltransferase n=1 Tax=uncultured Clostridium sp. TaxID=59620 RepID=UPI00259BC938|nr:GNAT family N-acetyltransferase [uncultured Clostridium sp.]